MSIVLRPFNLPDFGEPGTQPKLPSATYEARCDEAYRRAACDWLVVYADREHFANIAFLSGFDPRFEEALLLLGPSDRRVIITGNECQSYAALAGLTETQVLLAQSMSLMGQDRTRRPKLVDVLKEAGVAPGDTIGLAGWKYLETEEWNDETPSFFVPVFVVEALRSVVGGAGNIRDVTACLMHPETGLRSVIDADQIAVFEWAASRAASAVWRIVAGIRENDSEFEAAARMGYEGDPQNVHTMFASSCSDGPVVGLRSPTGRRLKHGDGVTSAVGFWGGLSSRAGLVAEYDEEFLKIASPYFDGLITWYETAALGVEGGTVFAAVTESLARAGLRSALNPGHLTGHDEWLHSPIRPGSAERIRSGMPFQVDIIPVPLRNGWALNCEDAVTFADNALRLELQTRHPATWGRIEARRAFVQHELGVAIPESTLLLSSTPLCLPPFWLASGMLLARA
jgi:Xaa-Pro aminopeptidase